MKFYVLSKWHLQRLCFIYFILKKSKNTLHVKCTLLLTVQLKWVKAFAKVTFKIKATSTMLGHFWVYVKPKLVIFQSVHNIKLKYFHWNKNSAWQLSSVIIKVILHIYCPFFSVANSNNGMRLRERTPQNTNLFPRVNSPTMPILISSKRFDQLLTNVD